MQDREVNRWFRVSKQVLRRAADDILRRFSACVRQRDEGKGNVSHNNSVDDLPLKQCDVTAHC